jgi:hypothetical protein
LAVLGSVNFVQSILSKLLIKARSEQEHLISTLYYFRSNGLRLSNDIAQQNNLKPLIIPDLTDWVSPMTLRSKINHQNT